MRGADTRTCNEPVHVGGGHLMRPDKDVASGVHQHRELIGQPDNRQILNVLAPVQDDRQIQSEARQHLQRRLTFVHRRHLRKDVRRELAIE